MNDAGKIAFTPKGDYDSTATYEYLDTVVYNGNAYAALKTTTGNAPEEGSEYWILLARGGTSVPAATEGTEGVVKASDDIGVDSNAKMVLKTDYTEQTELTEIESGETRKTFFGKIAKAISTLVNHININATSAKAGHVKLSNSSAVTDSTGLALPVTEKNASISGTLAYMLANFSGKLNLIWYNTGSNFTTDDDATSLKGYIITAPEEYMMFLIYSTDGNCSVLGNWDNCVSYLHQFLNVHSDNEYAAAIAYRKVTLGISHVSSGGYFKNIVFDKAYYKGVLANSQTKPYNGSCVPLRIYGIRK